MSQYGWLELNRGLWHFLTQLHADPEQATRRWSDSREALVELSNEGWTVVRPYSEQGEMIDGAQSVCGYGLARTIH